MAGVRNSYQSGRVLDGGMPRAGCGKRRRLCGICPIVCRSFSSVSAQGRLAGRWPLAGPGLLSGVVFLASEGTAVGLAGRWGYSEPSRGLRRDGAQAPFGACKFRGGFRWPERFAGKCPDETFFLSRRKVWRRSIPKCLPPFLACPLANEGFPCVGSWPVLGGAGGVCCALRRLRRLSPGATERGQYHRLHRLCWSRWPKRVTSPLCLGKG